ncbi:MAG: hypothetical protein SGJ20_19200 [Planctomycetota bacterium]|nr:hypothetical protein [Planctomycetota bacterium]
MFHHISAAIRLFFGRGRSLEKDYDESPSEEDRAKAEILDAFLSVDDNDHTAYVAVETLDEDNDESSLEETPAPVAIVPQPFLSFNHNDVTTFVAGYTSADECRICFAWNGKHAEEFDDANMNFRDAVYDFVLDDIEAVPIELVRDLFKAEAECSVEAWGICKSWRNDLCERTQSGFSRTI